MRDPTVFAVAALALIVSVLGAMGAMGLRASWQLDLGATGKILLVGAVTLLVLLAARRQRR